MKFSVCVIQKFLLILAITHSNITHTFLSETESLNQRGGITLERTKAWSDGFNGRIDIVDELNLGF
jgi:hypothetical protein